MRLFLPSVAIVFFATFSSAGAPEAEDVEASNRALFRSLWGDLWDPGAVGPVRDGRGLYEMTLAEAEDLFVARAGDADWGRLLASPHEASGPAPATVAAGSFELLEIWMGYPDGPEPRNCNQGSGQTEHHDDVVTWHHPFGIPRGPYDQTGTAWSNMTQVPGFPTPPAAFIDHGSTHATFLYDDQNVTYAGNSDFYCLEFGQFWILTVINNPRVAYGAARFADE